MAKKEKDLGNLVAIETHREETYVGRVMDIRKKPLILKESIMIPTKKINERQVC